MMITVEAIYENGALRLTGPLPLQENEKVRVTVESSGGWTARTAGMVEWSGDPGDLRRIAEGDDFGVLGAP
jgi:predicted DNA-binding antitoxin AbrB/MazE fold protein